jgi:hypothetical protein
LETRGSEVFGSGAKAKRRYVLVRIAEKGSTIDGHLATLDDAEKLSLMLKEDDVSGSPALSVEASSDADTEASERSEAARYRQV